MMQQINKRVRANLAYFTISLVAAGALLFSQFSAGVSAGPILLLPVCLLIFYIPGCLLIRTFFGGQTLDRPRQLLVMLLSGMATCILGGLYLYKTASGFSPSAWGIVFSPLVLCVLVDIWLTDPKREPGGILSLHSLGFNLPQVAWLGLAVLIVIAANLIMQTPPAAAQFQGYTQLWLHPCAGPAAPKVLIGVNSREFETIDYRLEVHHGAGAAVGSAQIRLQPGEDWQATLPLGELSVQTRELDVFLYRADQPTQVYRHVALRRPDWSLEQVNEIANSHCQ